MEKKNQNASGVKLIIGLGNPGSQYEGTRHNLGRSLVEFIAVKHRLKFSHKKSLKTSLVSFEWEGVSTLLAYPEIFMNLSGQSVGAMVRYYSVDPRENLLVLIDDAAIELGRLRLRPGGSDGGHNGLKSIDQLLGLTEYARLRLGIGPQQTSDGELSQNAAPVPILEKYVLEKFKKQEAVGISRILDSGYEACRLWLTGSMEQAMNTVNSQK